MQARVVFYQDVSRGRIETLDVTGVKMVCISYLDISGSSGPLRHLMQRLRQLLPGAFRSWSACGRSRTPRPGVRG